MNTSEPSRDIETLVQAWVPQTTDLTVRVAAGIGGSVPAQSEASELLNEIRSMRAELLEMRRESAQLREQIVRLRIDVMRPERSRHSPSFPSDDVVRRW
ncbi:MAG: hypothetical protein P4L46_05360 [Fimbriimonas sp.]|nr:hypothetical protein [Fimbriimonas sp.]